jgi:CheY-like chemotaxis protein
LTQEACRLFTSLGGQDVQGRAILVVDDDPTIRETLAVVLETEGYPVTTASNGLEALHFFERDRPSLVILDMHMPVLDGPGLVHALHARGFDPPILVVTATMREANQVARQLGAEAALPKPFELPAILTLVEQLRVP